MTKNLTTSRSSGRAWAYTGAVLGGLVSIAANVAHSYVPPARAAASWSPEPGAVASAVIWPVFLFVAIEILARYDWPAGRRWIALRFGGLLPVALVAAVVSYRHLSGLLGHYGEDAITVAFGPLAVDGLMVMATSALIATGRAGTQHGGDAPSTIASRETPTQSDEASVAAVAPEPEPAAELPAPVRPAVLPIPAGAFTRLNGSAAGRAQ